MTNTSDTIQELVEYDHYRYSHAALKFYASDIMEQLGYESYNDLTIVLNRAIQACRAMSIPVSLHFRQVFRYDGEKTWLDWRLSSLGCYLVVVNADPGNPVVARAQLYVFMKNR
jgi:hypothetical protein